MRRAAELGQIGGRGAGQDPGLKEPPGNQRRRLRLAETHSGVETVGHQIAGTAASHDFNRQLRAGGQEFPEARCEHETREEGIDIDPESAAQHRTRARGLGGGILDAGQQRLDSLIEAASVVGERGGTRGAIEQPDRCAPDTVGLIDVHDHAIGELREIREG